MFGLETLFSDFWEKGNQSQLRVAQDGTVWKAPSLRSDSVGANQARGLATLRKSWIPGRAERRGRGAAPPAPLIAYRFRPPRPARTEVDQGWICTRHWLCSFGQTHFLTNTRGAFSRNLSRPSERKGTSIEPNFHTFPLQIIAEKPSHKNPIFSEFALVKLC